MQCCQCDQCDDGDGVIAGLVTGPAARKPVRARRAPVAAWSRAERAAHRVSGGRRDRGRGRRADARLARAAADPWSRSQLPLHFTASALVVHPASRRVLLRWHVKQDRWLGVGGHGDPGETDPLQIALREAREETGLSDLVPWPDGALRHAVVCSCARRRPNPSTSTPTCAISSPPAPGRDRAGERALPAPLAHLPRGARPVRRQQPQRHPRPRRAPLDHFRGSPIISGSGRSGRGGRPRFPAERRSTPAGIADMPVMLSRRLPCVMVDRGKFRSRIPAVEILTFGKSSGRYGMYRKVIKLIVVHNVCFVVLCTDRRHRRRAAFLRAHGRAVGKMTKTSADR